MERSHRTVYDNRKCLFSGGIFQTAAGPSGKKMTPKFLVTCCGEYNEYNITHVLSGMHDESGEAASLFGVHSHTVTSVLADAR